MSNEMSWEEKLDAIQAVSGNANLCMRRPGNWYVSAPMGDIRQRPPATEKDISWVRAMGGRVPKSRFVEES